MRLKGDNMNIWHELDHPIHPLTHEEIASVLDGAQTGERAALHSLFAGTGEYVETMNKELKRGVLSDSPELPREFFIGHTIGMRAGMLELSVEGVNSSGFQVTTRAEIQTLRGSKAQGTRLQRSYASASLSFARMLQVGIQEKQGTAVMDRQPAPATIGLAIGLRYGQLSPAEGIAA
jgi:hypothetical protein